MMPKVMDAANWLILDPSYRIVAAKTTRGDVETRIGEVLLDAFPGTDSLYGCEYAKAWTGQVETDSFHRGALVHVTAQPFAGLLVYWEILDELETVTLAALSQSLGRLERLAARVGRGSGPRSLPELRIVPGKPGLQSRPPASRKRRS
jgi:hypothetical protein